MNKRAVTQAQLKRAVKVAASLGLTVAGFRVRPDGSTDLLLTDGANTPLPSDDLEAERVEWAKAHGYG